MAGLSDSKAFRANLLKAVEDMVEAERAEIWTSLPGKVVSYDPENQTVDVQPTYKPKHNGKAVDMPVLPKVKVIFPRAGGAGMTFPVKKGDGVLLSFMARDVSPWNKSGDKAEAGSARMHDLSSAVAILGFEPEPRKLPNVDPNRFQLRSDDGKNTLSFDQSNGNVDIQGEQAKFRVKGQDGEDLVRIIFDLLAVLETATTTVTFGSSTGIHPLTQNPQYGALKARLSKIMLG